jgi:hypothetical protein
MQLPLHRRVAAANRFDGLQRTTVAPRASSRPDRGVEQHALDLGPLAKALTAAAVAVSLMGRAGAAHADAAWKPRRHHRHIGERFTDTWADAIVEVRIAASWGHIAAEAGVPFAAWRRPGRCCAWARPRQWQHL